MNEPIVDEDVPVEYGDLDVTIQHILDIYSMLRDEYDSFSGRYIGKNFAGCLDLLELMDVEKLDKRFYLDIILVVDNIRRELYKPAETSSSKPQGQKP